MEPSPPGPCSSPPGPRPVPPPRKGSMERRIPREPSEGMGPGGQPGTPERATVTQRVLIVMERRSISSPSQGPKPPPGGVTGGPEGLGPPTPTQYTKPEIWGPPLHGSTTTDPGPIPPQYTMAETHGLPGSGSVTSVPDLGPPQSWTESRRAPPSWSAIGVSNSGPVPPPGSTTGVPDPGPVPPPGSTTGVPDPGPVPPPGSTTGVPDPGPVPPPGSTTGVPDPGPVPPPGSTTGVPDPGPVPPPGSTTGVTDPGPVPPPGSTTGVPDPGPVPPPGSTTGVPDSGPVPPPGSTTGVPDPGPVPPPGSTTSVPDSGPVPPPGSTTGVPDSGPVPPPGSTTGVPGPTTLRDSPRKTPQIRPVWVIPRKAPEAVITGGTTTHSQASPPSHKNTVLEEGALLPQTTQRTSPPLDTPSEDQTRSQPDNRIQGQEMFPLQDGGQQSIGAVASLLQKRAAVPEEGPVACRVMSAPDTVAEKTMASPSHPVLQSPQSTEALTQAGHQEPSMSSVSTTIEQPQDSLTSDLRVPADALKSVQSNGCAEPPPSVVIGPASADTTGKKEVVSPSMGQPPAQPAPSPHRNMSSKPPLPIPPRSSLYPGREQEASLSYDTASLSSFRSKAPAPDTLSYLDSVSLMSGTLESLTHLDDASSLGSDSEINGMPYRKTDKYGFLGGNQYSGNGEYALPVEIARQRELKWLEMFNHWDKWLTRRSQKVKLRCRKGIPSSLRARAWQYLCNSYELLNKNPGTFEELERAPGDPKWLDVIEKDLHRQFPFHEMFAARGGHGQQDLYRILKAYTVYRPEEGYCQAQAPVAAVLLMHMPAEQAFWCLVQICDKYLPGYYSAGLEAIQLDGEIFFALLRRVCPMAYRHLKKFKIDPILYMTEWFMCIFSRTLPWSSVLRVWDMFFCEGVKIIFRVGLVLLRHTLGSVDKLRSCQGMYETMEKLRSLPPTCMQEDVLLPEVSSLPVTDALIERESNTQLRKWRENRGELQYRPSRRLHGARQVHEERLRLNPALSGSRLSLSSLRRPSPPSSPALQPESVVVSEGLRPVLPSPTATKTPLGPPKEAAKKGKPKEQDKKKEKEERERERKREKEEREERERERKRERERERQKEKEERRLQKEKDKTEAKQKKERKISFRRKESSSPAADSSRGAGPPDSAHDTYF